VHIRVVYLINLTNVFMNAREYIGIFMANAAVAYILHKSRLLHGINVDIILLLTCELGTFDRTPI